MSIINYKLRLLPLARFWPKQESLSQAGLICARRDLFKEFNL